MTITEDDRTFSIEKKTKSDYFDYMLFELIGENRVFISEHITGYCAVEEVYNNILN